MPVKQLTPQQVHHLNSKKKEAIEYYQANGVPQMMENVLNDMFYEQPECACGYLANYFEKYCNTPYISKILVKDAVDIQGGLAFQIDIFCRYRNIESLYASLTQVVNKKLPDHAKPEEREKEAEWKVQEIRGAQTLCENVFFLQQLVLDSWDPQLQTQIDRLLSDSLSKLERDKLEELANEAANQLTNEDDVKETNATREPTKSAEKKGSAGKARKGKEIVIIPDEPKEELFCGSSALSAASLAICLAGASARKVQPFEHVLQCNEFYIQTNVHVPLPMITILCGGKASPGKSNCIKEYMLVPLLKSDDNESLENSEEPEQGKMSTVRQISTRQIIRDMFAIHQWLIQSLTPKLGNAARLTNEIGTVNVTLDRPEQGLDLIIDALAALDLKESYGFVLNLAGHEIFDYEKGKYEILTGGLKFAEELADFYNDLLNKYPQIIALIDPMRSVEREAWMNLCEKVSDRCLVISDQALPRPGRLLSVEELPKDLRVSGWTARLEQRTTLSELLECNQLMTNAGCQLVLAGCSSDAPSTLLVDIAVGAQARFLRLASGISRSDCLMKLERLSTIEDDLIAKNKLISHSPLQFPRLERYVSEKDLISSESGTVANVNSLTNSRKGSTKK